MNATYRRHASIKNALYATPVFFADGTPNPRYGRLLRVLRRLDRRLRQAAATEQWS